MEKKEKTCCVTGHRILTADQMGIALGKLTAEILLAGIDGYTTYITGMAKGIDVLFANGVLALRKHRPEVRLVAALSHRGAMITKDETFQKLIRECDRVVVLSEYYHPGVYAKRNRWMLEQSSRLIAAWDGRTSGGTYTTMREAEKMGLDIRKLDLNNPGLEPHMLNYEL